MTQRLKKLSCEVFGHDYPGHSYHGNTLHFCRCCGKEMTDRGFDELDPLTDEENDILDLENYAMQQDIETFFNRIPKDKYQHFIVLGFIPFWSAYMVFSLFWLSAAPSAGLISSIIASIFKEILDDRQGKPVDVYDALSGILCGILLWWMV